VKKRALILKTNSFNPRAQDDSITDEEALAKYGEYKMEFRRQQLNEFFVSHKEEEWFRLRYHPVLSRQAHQERCQRISQRLNIFLKMQVWLTKISCQLFFSPKKVW
jgi:hypothetical protein